MEPTCKSEVLCGLCARRGLLEREFKRTSEVRKSAPFRNYGVGLIQDGLLSASYGEI